MNGNTFVGDHVLLDVSFDAARRQLRRLSRDGVLLGASERAYHEGIIGLGEEAAMARLAGVESVDLTEKQDHARLGLRWDAISPDGTLFPALDADLTLSPAGRTTTALTLAGVYRLPNQAAAGLDPAIVRCFADMTIRCFIARLASALAHPANGPGDVGPLALPAPTARRCTGGRGAGTGRRCVVNDRSGTQGEPRLCP